MPQDPPRRATLHATPARRCAKAELRGACQWQPRQNRAASSRQQAATRTKLTRERKPKKADINSDIHIYNLDDIRNLKSEAMQVSVASGLRSLELGRVSIEGLSVRCSSSLVVAPGAELINVPSRPQVESQPGGQLQRSQSASPLREDRCKRTHARRGPTKSQKIKVIREQT